MATTRPLDSKYGISIGGQIIIDSERNLSVENAEIKNLNVTGSLTSVNSTNTLLRDNEFTLNAGNAGGQITALATITGGSGYTQGTYLSVPLTGGTGSGATADIVVNASGVVTNVTIQSGGIGYLATDTLGVSATNIDSGSDGTNFSVEVDTVTAGASSSDSFIYVSRGSTGSNVAIKWNETSDRWQFTNNGTTYFDIPTADTNTTYTASVVDSSGIKLRLSGSDSSSDDITFAASGAASVARTDENTITISATNTDTTYAISAEDVTGTAKLRLTAGGSGSGTDDVAFVGSGGTTVTRSDANTITIASTDNNTTYTTEVVSDGAIKLRLSGSDATNDDITFSGSGSVSVSNSGSSSIVITGTDTNTTYAISAETSSTTDAAKLTLTAGGSGSGTDDVTFVGSGGIQISRTDANTITINGGGVTDTNTTYSISALNDSGVKLRLTAGGSGSGTDDVTFVGSGATSVTVGASNDTITISSTDTNTTYSVSAEDVSGTAKLRLTAGGSGSGTDDIAFVGSGITSVTRTDADTITISTATQTLDVVTDAGSSTNNSVNIGGVKLNNGVNTTEIANIIASAPAALNANTATAIDTFTVSGYTTAKYIIQAIQSVSGKRQTTEILLFEDGSTVYMTEYATITNQTNNSPWITFDASSDGTTVSLTALVSDAATNNVTIKLIRETIV